MKKLVLLFVVLLAVVLVVGSCARRKTSGKFAEKSVTTVVTPADEESKKPLTVTATTKADGGALAVTSLKDSSLKTTTGYHVIRGTAPANTHSIKVNDYTLTHFMPGQKRWNYIASKWMGTLKEGANTYTVRALDAKGNELATTNFTIAYTAQAMALPGTGSPLLPTLLMTALGLLGWSGLKKFRFNI